MNTRMRLEPLWCSRCGEGLLAMANGGTIWLRCQGSRCGIIWPVEAAHAELLKIREGGGFPKDDPSAITVPGGRVRPMPVAESGS